VTSDVVPILDFAICSNLVKNSAAVSGETTGLSVQPTTYRLVRMQSKSMFFCFRLW